MEKKIACFNGVCDAINPLQDDYRIIDVNEETYQTGSDTTKLEGVHQSGAFLYFYIGGASFMKMEKIGVYMDELPLGSFVEVRDSFLSIITSFGTCKF